MSNVAPNKWQVNNWIDVMKAQISANMLCKTWNSICHSVFTSLQWCKGFLTVHHDSVSYHSFLHNACHNVSKCADVSVNVFPVLFRFLSIPKGFSYLNERGYVSKQLDKWQKVRQRPAPFLTALPVSCTFNSLTLLPYLTGMRYNLSLYFFILFYYIHTYM